MKPILLSFSILLALQASSAQTMFKVIAGRGDNQVQFESDAPLETVVGTTHTITGFVELDPLSDGAGARSEIHVDLVSLRTGIELRDRHMRENHLETDRFPETVFSLSSIALPAGGLQEGVRTSVLVKGSLLLHGVTRSIQPETFITYRQSPSGPVLSVESSFAINLKDFDIKRPQFLVMKLAEEQQVSVRFAAVANSSVAIESD